MGWGREGREGRDREALSTSNSTVKEPLRRMTNGKAFPDDGSEWNDDSSYCPLLRPVFQVRIASSNITISELIVTGNPSVNPVEQGPSETSQKIPTLKSNPLPAGDAPLTLGKYAIETPPQDKAEPSTADVFQSLEQIPEQLNHEPGQPTPKRSMPSFKDFLAARKQQREVGANTPAVENTALKTITYLAGVNTEYQDHLINIQQLMTYAKTNRESWHYVVGLYIQSFREPSTFQVALHCWEKDAWKADMLEKNPGSTLLWPDPARGSIEH